MIAPREDHETQGRSISPDYLVARINVLSADVKELTTTIARLVLVEERTAVMTSNLERAIRSIEGLDSRMGDIEKRMPEHARTSAWVDRAVWAAAAAFVMYVIISQGVIRP